MDRRIGRARGARGGLLAVDIGNTNVTFGLFRGEKLVREWRTETDSGKKAKEYEKEVLRHVQASMRTCIEATWATVVPALGPVFREVFRRLGMRAVEITTRSPLGMRLAVDIPSQVGADRLLNALAVHRLFGGPAVVVDFGTATTFDCVSRAGDYLGGAILPGPRLAAKALALHTAKLPEVAVAKPRRVVGKNTVECIQAGLYYGYLGMIERVLHGTIAEMRRADKSRVRLVATGGLVRLFLPDLSRGFRWVPDLTLRGLRLAHELCSGPVPKVTF